MSLHPLVLAPPFPTPSSSLLRSFPRLLPPWEVRSQGLYQLPNPVPTATALLQPPR